MLYRTVNLNAGLVRLSNNRHLGRDDVAMNLILVIFFKTT